jgi:diguanylate cyclase (GGDEF)-like protein
LIEIYNRRFVIKTFPKLLAKANKKKETLTVFIVDIDNFKKINDTQGHEFGDSVIHCIANALMKNIKKPDILARWGGDEFLIIMQNNDHMFSVAILEHVQAGLEHSPIQFGMPLSVSIGTSVYPDNGGNLNDLIKYADKRMYERKAEKRET